MATASMSVEPAPSGAPSSTAMVTSAIAGTNGAANVAPAAASGATSAAQLQSDETGRAIVPVLACVLHQLCTKNDKIPVNPKNVTKFHALRPPGISIREYLNRIAKYAACSGECFVLALVYIDRIIQINQLFVVNSLNIHRLLITSVMLAAKFFDDQYFNNAYYAKVGGVPCPEMNSLEVEFLFMTNFTLFVPTDTYRQYYRELCNHAANNTCGCAVAMIPDLVIPYANALAGDNMADADGSGNQMIQEEKNSSLMDVSKGGDETMTTDSPQIRGQKDNNVSYNNNGRMDVKEEDGSMNRLGVAAMVASNNSLGPAAVARQRGPNDMMTNSPQIAVGQ